MVYKVDEAFPQEMLDQLTEAVYYKTFKIVAEDVPVWIRLADFLDVSFLETNTPFCRPKDTHWNPPFFLHN